MPVSYWIYDGVPVKLPTSSGKKYDKFIADNDHLVGNEATKAEHDAALATRNGLKKKRDRNRAMPPLDSRMEAIFAALKHLGDNGTTFPAEVQSVIDDVETAKAGNPVD